jgi:addiction module HigA family antidote
MSIPVRNLREALLQSGVPDLKAVHPGEILLEDFLKPMGLTQTQLADDLGVPIRRINEICVGKRAISPETAWLLAEYFDMSVEYWAGLQLDYDLQVAARSIAERLKRVRRNRQQTAKQSA